jgi:hypothetical protein
MFKFQIPKGVGGKIPMFKFQIPKGVSRDLGFVIWDFCLSIVYGLLFMVGVGGCFVCGWHLT